MLIRLFCCTIATESVQPEGGTPGHRVTCMTIMHLADLHFGKNLHGLNLIAEGDQPAWIRNCYQVIEEEKPDVILLCGDIFDRSQPSAEARSLCSEFLTGLCQRNIPVLMIAGNHDSPETIEYLQALVRNQGLYVSGQLHSELQKITLQDAFGPVHFYMLPYFFPAKVAQVLQEDIPSDYTMAAQMLLERQQLNPCERNVLLAHQFVCSTSQQPVMGGSESSVGGVGQLDASVLDAFDYVALGHIHRPQAMHRPGIRYAGTPMCYHFSEAGRTDEGNAQHGIQIIRLGAKSETPEMYMHPVTPLHPLRNICGMLEEIIEEETTNGRQGEYIHVRLSDPVIPDQAYDRLLALFESKKSRLLWLDRVPRQAEAEALPDRPHTALSLPEMFHAYYDFQYPNQPMNAEDETLIEHAARILDEHQYREDTLDVCAESLLTFLLGKEARG